MIYPYQTIKTKWLRPTNAKGTRIKASCHAKSRIYDYDHELSFEQNHAYAAKQLHAELKWTSLDLVGGQYKNDSYIFVQVPKK